MDLSKRIENYELYPYIYSYPPTRSYRPLRSPFDPSKIKFTNDLNIYIHIPFCEQKCSFCNFMTIVDTPTYTLQDGYVTSLISEILLYDPIMRPRRISSINFGGGTPSLLTPRQLNWIMNALSITNPEALQAREISIEATPESVTKEKFMAFKELGINRVSLGVQTLNNNEIALARRHNIADISLSAFETLRTIGIPNICCDLMYGLPGQTFETWIQTVEGILALRPDTVELYGTVAIPGTPLARRNLLSISNETKFNEYATAASMLLEAGYVQDCHLRFILPGTGGYQQQANVFAGQSLLGVGVGARTYAVNAHYRNIYSTYDSRNAIRRYSFTLTHEAAQAYPVETLVRINKEEAMRRYIVYNLEHLDLNELRRKFNIQFTNTFGHVYRTLLNLELASMDGDILRLTPRGLAFRDTIAQEFFSHDVKAAETAYWWSHEP